MNRIAFIVLLCFSCRGMAVIDLENINDLQQIIESKNATTIREAKFFVIDLVISLKVAGYLEDDFSYSDLKESILNRLAEEISNDEDRQKAEAFITLLFDSIQNENLKKISFPVGAQVVERKEESQSLPPRLISGIMEVSGGCLLWVVPPLRPLGTGLIVDGIRRMLDSAEEKEKNNNIHRGSSREIVGCNIRKNKHPTTKPTKEQPRYLSSPRH